ncbi:MoaD/ThiS family protein [Nesterenkonia sp. AY15]|nr:MoaD/ThiS family protein [Nesterenkonia sp. AY15]
MSVRFFAAAAEAAGVEELRLPVPAEGVAVVDLLTELPRLVREQLSTTAGGDDPAGDHDHDRNTNDGAAVPGLERVCARSSFLVNGVRARSETARLHPGDQLDVLPPFAGG